MKTRTKIFSCERFWNIDWLQVLVAVSHFYFWMLPVHPVADNERRNN